MLWVDPRAQGGSEGERITMGYREVRDVRGALSWLKERGFTPDEVVLHGFSRGDSVRGSTRERGCSGRWGGFLRQLAPHTETAATRGKWPAAPFTPGMYIMTMLFLGIDPWAVRPEEDAQRLYEEGVSLLIHSKDDEEVPFRHAQRIKKACPEAAFWKIEGYEHVGSYAHPQYQERLLNFLRTSEAQGSTY
jgi:fermentation-respiration switch protein FrsA (DUF1100 family)